MQFLESLQEEMDLGQPSIASEADDVVRVMSIHRSKGQEFPVVIVPDLGKRINLSDCQGAIVADRTAGLGMAVVDEDRMIRYPSLAQVLVQRRIKQQALAEEMRVLYVAMTRAREHLILIGTCKDATVDGWGQRWAGYDGAFPPDAILSARTMLDWLGPVAIACGEGIIRVTRHASEEILSWQTAHAKRPELTTRQWELARLQPLASVTKCAEADLVVQRLEFVYPFDEFTKIQASGAMTKYDAGEPENKVSAEPKLPDTIEIAARLEPRPPARPAHELSSPGFFADYAASPADIGTATHLVLQHLDFDSGSHDVKTQVQEMISRKLISEMEAKLVDIATIEWFLSTETAALIRRNLRRLRRELPIYSAVWPHGLSSTDPRDRVMVRGRIDLLVCLDEGAVIIDYKTDRVSADQVAAHAAEYHSQMEQYSNAIEKITGLHVSQVRLVFLAPRVEHLLM
jgi:ATP-dependent helicase/nuclease subunit A